MDEKDGRVSRRRFGSKKLKREERVSGSNAEANSSEVRERRARNRRELLATLHVKLRSFEEDTNHMKKAVVRLVDERSLLMSEIARQLQLLEGYSVGLQGGNCSDAASSSASTVKDEHKSIGLSEVLLQESKRYLVTRDIEVDLDAFRDLAWHSQYCCKRW